MKVEATMEFTYKNLGKFKKGQVFETEATDLIRKLIFVGYFKEVREEKELKEVIESKEFKGEITTKVKKNAKGRSV